MTVKQGTAVKDEKVQHDLNCLNIRELEKLATERLDKKTRDYYNEGADTGLTVQENMTAYQNYRLRPRVLRNVAKVDSSVPILGTTNSVPFGVAPAAMQCLAHPDGEAATARACREKNVIMGLSTFSTTSLEEVGAACGDVPNVLQLYLFEEREQSARIIRRAREAGYKAVALTVDTPFLGRRNLEIRNQFKLPPHLRCANFDHQEEAPKSSPASSDGDQPISPTKPATFHSHAACPNPALVWEECITWLKKEAAPMQVWIKGLVTPEDAVLAVEHGADGIIVSNHGGRQLDGAMAALDALPAVVEAVGGRIPVHIDGGIRHGTDIFKALALGADFCWVGRPVLWGLAYNGQAGVELCLNLLMDEFRLCMALMGVTKVSEIGPDHLCKVEGARFLSRL